MHESSMAAEIVDSVMEFLRLHPDSEILAVRLQIGELTCIDPEHLNACYESITRQTLLEGSQLEPEIIKAIIRCCPCMYEGFPLYLKAPLAGTCIATVYCPKCKKAAEIVEGHECLIRSLQVFDQEPVMAPAVSIFS